jgi:phytoene dehydrogenase-like protein
MPQSFDAVFVGAGHNSAGRRAAHGSKGLEGRVFEQAAVTGGAVKTGEYTLPGFRHDWAAMNLSLFAGSPFFKQYGAELSQHGCGVRAGDTPLRQCLPGWRWCGVSTDLAETTAKIASLSPAMPKPGAGWSQASGRGAASLRPSGQPDEISCACIFHA